MCSLATVGITIEPIYWGVVIPGHLAIKDVVLGLGHGKADGNHFAGIVKVPPLRFPNLTFADGRSRGSIELGDSGTDAPTL